MKVYEKAIKNFREMEKERCKENIDSFIEQVKKMIERGECQGIECFACQINLYRSRNAKLIFCNETPKEKMIEMMMSEV